jgi:hypothetical protein
MEGVHQVFDNEFVDGSETQESCIRPGEQGTWDERTMLLIFRIIRSLYKGL